MLGRIIGSAVCGVIGIVLLILGLLVWKKEKINILHDYHVDKVRPEDRAAFCRLSGIGIVLIGAGLTVTAVLLAVTNSAASFLCFAAGFAAGLALLVTAGVKYNR